MTIYLVRHGEAAASWGEAPDPGLSPLGVEQAVAAAGTLNGQLDVARTTLISSPMARARETATPLAAELGLEIQIDEAFQEIRAPVPLSQRQAWLRQFMGQRWDEQPENLLQWRDRACGHLLELRGPAVVFTHFLVINAVVGRIQGSQATLCCWPDNGSITQLRLGERGLELVALGAQMETVVT